MKFKSSGIYAKLFIVGLAVAISSATASAQVIQRGAFGANPAAIQGAVDQFRADLGELNPNTAQTFSSGRREINWDGVPNGVASPNPISGDFFNVNSPRGVVFTSTAGPVVTGGPLQPFQISSTVASGVPVRFGNVNPTYTNEFQTFSGERLFTTTRGSNVVEIAFRIPGTDIPATVSGFGAVFTDVDSRSTIMQFYDDKGKLLRSPNGPVEGVDKGLSFQGVSYNDGTRISKVVIVLGNVPLSAGTTDGQADIFDVVAMDDFIYGEPRAAEFHSGDADGDGVADARVFRPATGTWFTINSGSSTVSIEQFGLDGDIPIDGDFDGDSRADISIFRPSDGNWWIRRSSDKSLFVVQWGLAGDIPVAADYDKDKKTDIAVWRPSEGNYYTAFSSTGFSTNLAFNWGENGDVPVHSATH
ncbi:MAG: VCBS repeat-containing protein [Pyrinomonadaceae bacterium]